MAEVFEVLSLPDSGQLGLEALVTIKGETYKIWYRVSGDIDRLAEPYNALLAATLIPAMRVGESLHI